MNLLFSANKWGKDKLMKGILQTGTNIILDRYFYSGFAYSSDRFELVYDKGLLIPDLIIYLERLRNDYGADELSEFQIKDYRGVIQEL